MLRSSNPANTSTVHQIHHPYPYPGRFIHVGRADAPACGADLVFTLATFFRLVQQPVVREDHVGPLADFQVIGVDSPSLQGLQLFYEHFRVDYHAAADDTNFTRIEDAGGN